MHLIREIYYHTKMLSRLIRPIDFSSRLALSNTILPVMTQTRRLSSEIKYDRGV